MLRFNRTCWCVTKNHKRFIGGDRIPAKGLLFSESPPTFHTKQDAQKYAEHKIEIWKNNGCSDSEARKNITITKVRINITPL